MSYLTYQNVFSFVLRIVQLEISLLSTLKLRVNAVFFKKEKKKKEHLVYSIWRHYNTLNYVI